MPLREEIGNLPGTTGKRYHNHQVVYAAVKDHDARLATIGSRAPIPWLYHGTGTPTLAGFPGARVGDVIRRMSDGQEWRVDE